MSTENLNNFVVYHSRPRMKKAAIQNLFFLLLAIFILWHGLEKRGGVRIYDISAAVYLVLVFGPCLLWALKRLRVATPALIIGGEGIFDHSSAIGVGQIAWKDIASAYVRALTSQPYLCLVPRDVKAFLRSQPVWRRLLMLANIKLLGAPIIITALALPISLDELKAKVDAHLLASTNDQAKSV